ncbi:MG2 domain-containing protein [uncultured Maribacter sp.]|uniref:alpha-2-macroglobulin family protein n=1 Tax=uncultured Maribacter sp. TaxID=431308 RepID=UPI0026294CA1|nr:MG2 domain-containing protein [uncultured Maribacter sp.]
MNSKSIFYLFFFFIVLISCNSKQKNASDTFDDLSKYQDYISEVSHGIISVKSDVRVVFNSPIEGWENGLGLDKSLFKVSPKVAGKVIALDNKTIAFVPEKAFKQDTDYAFTLDLKTILPNSPEEIKEMSFGVKTIKQQFNIYTNAIQSYSKEYQYINGQLRSSDVLSLENAKTLVSITHKGKKITPKFDGGLKEGTQFSFTIDSIQRFEEDSELLVTWTGKALDIESAGENKISIAGKNNFTILDVTLDPSENQIIVLNFSDPIKKSQNFKGLIVLQGDDKPKYSVDGNVLKIYPSKEMSGTALLEIFDGIESADGYKLKSKFTERVAFEEIKPQIRLLSNGTILPSSNNLKINFEAVNLKAVDVTVLKIYENNILQFLQNNSINGQGNLRSVARPIITKKIDLVGKLSNNNGKWTAHALDLKSIITPEVGAIYRVEFTYKGTYSLYTCSSTNFEAEDPTDSFDEEQENSSWDGVENYYNDYYYDYNWSERENPCNTSYYYNKKIGINVLATDIGVTVKKGLNKSYFIAVNDIVSTKPIAGAKVTFYNYQQQEVGKVTTDEKGISFLDSDKLAFFAIVESNGQKNYIKLNDGNALSVSKFNVSGVQLQKGIKGFIFAERGVWRPGDKIYLSFMLNDNANKLPENHPVKLELLDPYNSIVHREVKTNGVNNFYNFSLKTDENAVTGNWLAKVSVGGASFTKTLKIETIKPNRLKIKTAFDKEVLSSKSPVDGEIEVKWLHGAIAKNLKADITGKFNAKKTTFKTFPGYVFDDPSRSFSSEEQVVFNGKINAEGKAKFNVNPQVTAKAPGMLNAAFITKVYENGGDFSTDVFTKQYSPYSTYVGLNAPKGDKRRGMLLTDVKHKFEVVSVDENGKPKAAKNLKVTIHKVNWRWWWDTSADNLSSYSSSQYREEIFSKTISTSSNGKGSFEFELKYPDWGRYLVRVEDTKGGHATGKAVYVDWPGWAGKSKKNDPSAATMLSFSADKENYNVGENATISFPSSEGGRALVTVENGSEVLESLWVETTKEETKFILPITELYTPNVFIHITLLQPHASTLNDNPIRLYGLVPIAVENPETKLEPVVSMPDVLRPEEEIKVTVKENKGKAMTYSIAIVDEGLLDLTRFKTPNPWNTFYAKEALGVKTWDVYDDVIGAFGGKVNQVFAIGGDDELAGAKNKKANRFEPMVVHLGPFELKAGKSKSHKIKIPKYVGSVRTMVVAGDVTKEAYGIAEKTTPVRKPLMILASLPRKITSGEKVTLPVTVFAMEKKIKNVTLKIKQDKAFTVEGGASQSLSFSEPEEKMAYFTLNVSDFKGIGKVVVEASGNGEKASFEIPIDVVNPNPMTSNTEAIILEANAEKTISIESFGINGSNSLDVEFSTLPAMNFNGRMQQLIRYPHGCVEQTTSGAFPQLFLTSIFDVTSNKKKRIQQNIESAIKRLGGFQLANGGLGYWPGQKQANDWGTTYAGHFLLEAEKRGYVLPIGFKSSWVDYQKQIAKQWRSGNTSSSLAQAYRLYTLALSGNADIASMNRLRETKELSNDTYFKLAAAYAQIGQSKVAKDLLLKAKWDFVKRKNSYYTYGSALRNKAMALETVVLVQDKVKAQQLAKEIAGVLAEKEWLSTQETAYSLLSMAKFADMVGGKGISTSISVNGKSDKISTSKTLVNRNFEIKKGANTVTIKNKEDNAVYVSLITNGILPVGQEKVITQNLNANVVYKNRNGSTLEIAEIQQGTDFVAEVTITNTSTAKLNDMAMSQIFPSGWEIVNTRFTDFGSFAENNVTHTDIRDDRANFYFDMKPKESKTFRVLLNASYLGTYYLPGVQAEAMYNNDYMVRTKGQWVKVVQ